MRHRTDHQADPCRVVVKRADFGAGVRTVDGLGVVRNESVVIERHEERAIIVVTAEVDPAGGVDHQRRHPAGLQVGGGGQRNAHQKTVVLIEREILQHRRQAVPGIGDDHRVGAGLPPTTAGVGRAQIAQVAAVAIGHGGVKGGNHVRVLPVKGCAAGVQIVLHLHVAVRHDKQISVLLKRWRRFNHQG